MRGERTEDLESPSRDEGANAFRHSSFIRHFRHRRVPASLRPLGTFQLEQLLDHALRVLGDVGQPHQPERTQQAGRIEKLGREAGEDAGGDAGIQFGVGALRANTAETPPATRPTPTARPADRPVNRSAAASRRQNPLPAGDRRRTRSRRAARQMADQQIGPASARRRSRLSFMAASTSMAGCAPGTSTRDAGPPCGRSSRCVPRLGLVGATPPIVGTEHGRPHPREHFAGENLFQHAAHLGPRVRSAGAGLRDPPGCERRTSSAATPNGPAGPWRWSSTVRCCRPRSASRCGSGPVRGRRRWRPVRQAHVHA